MRFLKYFIVIVTLFSLFSCSNLSSPKPKYSFKAGDNEGVICLKRSTQHELIYSIIPSDKDKNYFIDTQIEGNRVYIYSISEDANRTASMPWNKLIPALPNRLYVPSGTIYVYWGDRGLDSFGLKDKACYKQDRYSSHRLDKDYFKESGTNNLVESIAHSIVESYFENMMTLP